VDERGLMGAARTEPRCGPPCRAVF